jgi:hypothetical protein
MAHTAVHRAPTALPNPRELAAAVWAALSPGQQFTARVVAALAVLWQVAYTYGQAGRNPFTDLAAAAGAIWALSTNPVAWVAGVVVLVSIAMFRRAINSPKGSHRA